MNADFMGGVLLMANVGFFVMAVGRGDKVFAWLHAALVVFVAVAWLT